MNYLEVLTITRRELEETALALPTVGRQLRRMTIQLAARRAFVREAERRREAETRQAHDSADDEAACGDGPWAAGGGGGGGGGGSSASRSGGASPQPLRRPPRACAPAGKPRVAGFLEASSTESSTDAAAAASLQAAQRRVRQLDDASLANWETTGSFTHGGSPVCGGIGRGGNGGATAAVRQSSSSSSSSGSNLQALQCNGHEAAASAGSPFVQALRSAFCGDGALDAPTAGASVSADLETKQLLRELVAGQASLRAELSRQREDINGLAQALEVRWPTTSRRHRLYA